jgi:HlyD family secretion protein
MSRGAKFGVIISLVLGGIVALGAVQKSAAKNRPVEVKMEPVAARNLVAAVTASGKIQAKTKVDVSADVTGRILRIAVREGQQVTKGQFLLQIDPVQFQGAVARGEAALANAQAALVQARTNREQSKRSLDRAAELSKTPGALISREAVEQAQQAYDVAMAVYESNEALVEQAKAGLKEARDNLARTTLYAPISGRVVRLAVEEGEVAVPGTFSKETGLLMTIADMSVILAKVPVDETDVVRLSLGDSVQVKIDAFTDSAFSGRVTKVSNSAKLVAGAGNTANQDRAVDFDVEITLDHPPADVRPDLSCTARIITDTRTNALSVPIIALTVRQHEPLAVEGAPKPAASTGDSTKDAKAKEREGVFVVREGIATFRPVKIGVAGDEHFEVLEGLKAGELIVSGTYQAIRDLKDGAKVKEAKADSTAVKAKTT